MYNDERRPTTTNDDDDDDYGGWLYTQLTLATVWEGSPSLLLKKGF